MKWKIIKKESICNCKLLLFQWLKRIYNSTVFIHSKNERKDLSRLAFVVVFDIFVLICKKLRSRFQSIYVNTHSNNIQTD